MSSKPKQVTKKSVFEALPSGFVRGVPNRNEDPIPSPRQAFKEKTVLLLILTVLSGLLHFVKLTYPNEVIFDEVHFGKMITAYCCTGERFFDIHPPHGKLLVAAAAKLGGHHAGFAFDKIGDPYGEVPTFALRFVNAFCGALLPLLFFSLIIQLGGNTAIAFLGAACVLFDNALLLHSRILGLDMQLLASELGAFVAYLGASKSVGRKRIGLLILAGALAGLAVGTKFTGLTAIALLFLLVSVPWSRDKHRGLPRKELLSLSIMAMSGAVIYVVGWALHFSLLDKPGGGDAFYKPTGHFFTDFFALQKVMGAVNAGIRISHPFASRWWAWPIMKVPPMYWTGNGSVEYLVGNPVVWWGSLVGILLLLARAVFKKKRKKARPTMLWFPLIGYLGAYLPFSMVERPLFLYHYFTPLLFAILATLLWLESRGFTSSDSVLKQRRPYYAVMSFVVLGFLFVSPLTFAMSFPWYKDQAVRLFERWRN